MDSIINNLRLNMVPFKSLVPILTVFTAMYGPRLSPKLPNNVRKLVNSGVTRMIIIFIILFMSNRDVETSLGIMITYSIASMILQRLPVSENFSNKTELINPCTYCGNKLKCDYDKCLLKTDRIINRYKTNYLNPN